MSVTYSLLALERLDEALRPEVEIELARPLSPPSSARAFPARSVVRAVLVSRDGPTRVAVRVWPLGGNMVDGYTVSLDELAAACT